MPPPEQRIAHFSSAAAPFAGAASIPSGTGDAGFSAKLMALCPGDVIGLLPLESPGASQAAPRAADPRLGG